MLATFSITIRVRWEAVGPELAEYRARKQQVRRRAHHRRRRKLTKDLCNQKGRHHWGPCTK